jgi:DNA-binding protein H-NS
MAKTAKPNVNYGALMTQISALTEKAQMVRQQETASVVSNIRKQMEEFGLSFCDIQTSSGGVVGKRVGRPATRSSAAKTAKSTLSTIEKKVVAKKAEKKDNKIINNTSSDKIDAGMMADAVSRKNKFATRRKPEPKFMNPETGQTWSGRGKTPKWLEGRRKSRFAIKADAVAA